MKKYTFAFLVFFTWLLVDVCPQAMAQDPSVPADEEALPAKKKHHKDKKNKDNAEQELSDAAVAKVASAFFPDWSPPGFSWGLRPIVAAKYTKQTDPNVGEIKTTTFEAGLSLGLFGIPVVPGNAGLYLAPTAGYVWGNGANAYRNTKDDDTFSYQRRWANLDTILYWRFFRYTLGLGRGDKVFGDEKKYPKVDSASIKNDFGFLILSWMSAHYTHKFVRVFSDNFSKPDYESQDNWLHAKVAFDLLNFYFDFGPGFTNAEEFGKDKDGDRMSLAKGREDYLLLLLSCNPFWKLGFSGRAKYAYASTEKNLGNEANTKLPDEGLYAPTDLVMPEDSLNASSFIGLNNLFLGIGVGWYYNLQILNMSEKHGTQRETTRDNGFGFSFAASF